jgi:hypothetical protein
MRAHLGGDGDPSGGTARSQAEQRDHAQLGTTDLSQHALSRRKNHAKTVQGNPFESWLGANDSRRAVNVVSCTLAEFDRVIHGWSSTGDFECVQPSTPSPH